MMGGDLSGRNGSGTEKYFPAEREAMEKAAKERYEKDKEIRADAFNEAILEIKVLNRAKMSKQAHYALELTVRKLEALRDGK